jgi:hypothetical protein
VKFGGEVGLHQAALAIDHNVQLAVGSTSMPLPRLELTGFVRIALNTGETQKAEIQIAAKDLEFQNPKLVRVLPHGKYQIRVGSSFEALGSAVTINTKSAAATSVPIAVYEGRRLTRRNDVHAEKTT